MAEISNEELLQTARAAEVSEQGLSVVSGLANQQLELETDIENAELELKLLKQQHLKLSSEALPDAMREHGISKLELVDGSVVTVSKIVKASIRVANREEAFAWLDSNGFGDLIKHKVTAELGRGEDEKAELVVEELRKIGIIANNELSVHPQTLGAWVREQAELGHAIPDDLLGVYRGEQTKIKRAK